MLHTMIKNPRPTRAEVVDVANAIYYRTDALMLSGETAYGKIPVEAVRTMATIAKEAKKQKCRKMTFQFEISTNDLTLFLCNAAVATRMQLGTKAIITYTYSGRTARFFGEVVPAAKIRCCRLLSRTVDTRAGIVDMAFFHFTNKPKAIRSNILEALQDFNAERMDRKR